MIKTSVVGCGYFGSVYLRRLFEHARFDVVSIVETNEESQHAGLFGVPVFGSVDEALDHGADLVVVCTPASVVADAAVAALSRSVSVLLCKPGAETLGQAQRIVRTARENRAVVMVDYTPRNTSAWQHLKLEQPRMRMHVQTARHNTAKPRHDVGVMLDLAAHDIALICDLTSRSLSVTDAWTACDGEIAGIRLTDNDIVTASISVQHSAAEQVRMFGVVDGWHTTRWDQSAGMITSGANGYWETIITHDVRDPVSVQLDRTAKAMKHKIDDDSSVFLRVMDVLDQAINRAKEEGKCL